MRDYHSLPLCQHVYRELYYEDQFAFELFAPGPELISFALARDQRNFRGRDRQMLNLLRPHLARAYRHVEQIELLSRALQHREREGSGAKVTAILLDADDRPVQFGAKAQHFGISPLRVRTHLEHLFDKLRVPSRTAAVTLFRHTCAGEPGFGLAKVMSVGAEARISDHPPHGATWTRTGSKSHNYATYATKFRLSHAGAWPSAQDQKFVAYGTGLMETRRRYDCYASAF
ncbi:MAG TPA: hypothetical protein VGA56_01840 [Opitutaceae bacterium]